MRAVIPAGSLVYVNPNGVHFAPHTHTDPVVLEALLAYLRDHGYRQLAVMESCTHMVQHSYTPPQRERYTLGTNECGK